jgi:hypothetical protein
MWWKPPTRWKHGNQFKKCILVVQKILKLGTSIVHTNMYSHAKVGIQTRI